MPVAANQSDPAAEPPGGQRGSAACACSRPRAPASARAASPARRSGRSRSARGSRTGCSTSSSRARSICSRSCCARSSATGCARWCRATPRRRARAARSRACSAARSSSAGAIRCCPRCFAATRASSSRGSERPGATACSRHRDLVASLLRRGIEAGEFKADLDVASVADVICQLQADYSARAYRRDPGYPDSPVIIDAATRFILDAVRA